MHVFVPRRFSAPARRATQSLLGDVDRLFDAFWQGAPVAPLRTAPAILAPRMDYAETEAEIRLAVELPGIDEENIRVSIEDGVVMVAAERKAELADEEEKTFRHLETYRGRLERKVRLPAEVDADAIRATHRNGVLTVTLPKLQPAVHSIPVTVS